MASERCGGATGAGATISATGCFAVGFGSIFTEFFVAVFVALFVEGFVADCVAGCVARGGFAAEVGFGFAVSGFAAGAFAFGALGSREGVRAELTLTASSFFDFVFEFALTTSADLLDLPDERALRAAPRAEVDLGIVRRV